MTDKDIKRFRGVVKEEINLALEPVNDRLAGVEAQLNNPKTGLRRINEKLEALWDQTKLLTEGFEEVKDTLDSHTVMLKKTSENIERLDDRVTTAESHLGISTPPELSIIR